MTDDDSQRLGRMDANILNLMEWKKDHEDHDRDRFEKTFAFVKDGFDKMTERFDKTDQKIDTLWDEKNVRSGESKRSKLIYAAVVSLVSIVAGYFGGAHGSGH